jgi:hypothetical protein
MITVLEFYKRKRNFNKNFLIAFGIISMGIFFNSTITIVLGNPCTEVTVNGANGAGGTGGTGGIGDTGGTGGIRGTGGTGGFNGAGGTGGTGELEVNGLGIAIVQCNIEIDNSNKQ